jgi:hypothetical protein
MFDNLFDWKQPYRWRTNLRILLPRPFGWFLAKGEDCEAAGGSHEWYNIDNRNSGCYHCKHVRVGCLWEIAPQATVEEREGVVGNNY